MSDRYFERKTQVQASLHMCTPMVLLMSIAIASAAPAAGTDCEAFGRVYRDGQSFTLSTGEYGDRRIYICSHGKWNDYDDGLWQRHRAARPSQ
jgi:hypothetical protein